MSWSLQDSKGNPVPPLVYSNGKSQEDIIEEILSLFKHNDIVFLKGNVGTGKSPIALHVASHFGKGIVVTPTKILEEQYVRDYCEGGKYRIIKNDGDPLSIVYLMGKSNYPCWYSHGLRCGNKDTLCSKALEEHQSRIQVASECPHWSPVYSWMPETFSKYLPDRMPLGYDSVNGPRFVLMAQNPCPYYRQFLYYTKNGIMVMNLAKWEIETWIGRKPVVPIEIIDEGDLFMDGLTYRVSISRRLFGALKREGLVKLELIEQVERAFESLMTRWGHYDDFVNWDIANFIDIYAEKFAGASTSGIVCDTVNKAMLIMQYRKYSWARITQYGLTVFIPRPDITFSEIRKRSGKMLIMSATIHTPRILGAIFRLSKPDIVYAEDKNAGTIYIKRTGKEVSVKNKSWEKLAFQKEYWENFDNIIKRAKRPCLVQVHAYKYLPEKYQEYVNKNIGDVKKSDLWFSTVTDRGIDLPDDMCRSIVILKYPIPNIDDVVLKTMRKILGDGKFWMYINNLADRDLVQQCGRAVRNTQDWCEIYTLDSKVLSRLPVLWNGKYVFQDEREKGEE